MDAKLTRKIRLVEKQAGLYGWCLQEVDDSGGQIGRDWFPWPWTLRFSICELTVESYLYSERDELDQEHFQEQCASPDDIEEHGFAGSVQRGNFRRYIVGKLVPESTFSMFGSDREIKSFDLYIMCENDDVGSDVNCLINGGFEIPGDFEMDGLPESLGVQLRLASAIFEMFAEAVMTGQVDKAYLGIGRVDGAYSHWSPSARTYELKILLPDKKHEVSLPDGSKFTPLRIGKCGQATLNFQKHHHLSALKLDDLLLESEADAESQFISQDIKAETLIRFVQKMDRLESLRVPVWIAAIALVVVALATLF